ncbi:MAG: PQQ-like beta-propeller repeat protein [Verrucomicrobia bacterium]|nr:PQQ-like beta-propeller repeat protein [Verrucomicrobiota bacterium]
MKSRILTCSTLLMSLIGMMAWNDLDAAEGWDQFRGPGASSTLIEGGFPSDIRDEKSIRWKISLPGEGLSSPVLHQGRVYLTASGGPDQKILHILCYDGGSGKKIWERRLLATGRTMCHEKTAVAAPTPVIGDGRIFALFSSNDLVCFDLDGRMKWFRGLTLDYPNASNSLGMASSPIYVDGVVVVQIENDSQSFSAGINPENGRNLWLIDRPKAANWTSPVPVEVNGAPAVALQSSAGISVVSPRNGQELWKYSDGASTIPSSVAHAGVLYVPSNGITALQLGAPGEPGAVLWNSRRLRPSTPSPVVNADSIFTVNNAGVVTCASLADGERKWDLRLSGPFSATPLVAGNQLLFVNENGWCNWWK